MKKVAVKFTVQYDTVIKDQVVDKGEDVYAVFFVDDNKVWEGMDSVDFFNAIKIDPFGVGGPFGWAGASVESIEEASGHVVLYEPVDADVVIL